MLSLSLGLGQRLNAGRDNNDMPQVIAVMILIVAIGYVVDGVLFRSIERRLQHKWGLLAST
jgi:NitT/TauT family transport system permease protein